MHYTINHELRVRWLSAISLASRQCGFVAVALQSRTVNDGKQVEAAFAEDDEALRLRRAAKTVVDEVVQEALLMAASTVLDESHTYLDAEEHTPSVLRFSADERAPVSLVIDPIDGTIDYVEGRDSYSIVTILAAYGAVASATVYFPKRDELYYLDEAGVARLAQDVMGHGLERSIPLGAQGARPRVIYKNGRVPAALVGRLEMHGFTVIDDTADLIGCAGAIRECISGRALAYLAHSRNMRDIGMGAVVGGCVGGSATDWSGQPLEWPSGGRVPRACFGFLQGDHELFTYLRDF